MAKPRHSIKKRLKQFKKNEILMYMSERFQHINFSNHRYSDPIVNAGLGINVVDGESQGRVDNEFKNQYHTRIRPIQTMEKLIANEQRRPDRQFDFLNRDVARLYSRLNKSPHDNNVNKANMHTTPIMSTKQLSDSDYVQLHRQMQNIQRNNTIVKYDIDDNYETVDYRAL